MIGINDGIDGTEEVVIGDESLLAVSSPSRRSTTITFVWSVEVDDDVDIHRSFISLILMASEML